MANEYYSATDIQFSETQLLRDLANAVQDATDTLISITTDLREVELRKGIEKAAHLEAINFITDRAEDILSTAFMAALFSSVEYNHELFVGRSMDAIKAHWDDILYVTESGNPGDVVVRTDFYVLGDIDMYAQAVEATRTALELKMTDPPSSRSLFWARNIYGVDREGKSVKRSKKKKDGTTETVDVTEKYIGKWYLTVSTRLGFIEADKAPWWYILNYGNEDAFSESEGMPYPLVHGTNFVQVLETQVKDMFDRIYRQSLAEWENWYADALARDYGLDDFDDPDEVLRVLEPKLVEQIERQEELEPTNRTVGILKENDIVYELYISSNGRISRRYSLSKN